MFQHNPVQKTKKYRRYFEKNTNISIAATAKETIFSKTLSGIFRELNFIYDGDNATGSIASSVTITVDSIVILDAITLSELCEYFCGESSGSTEVGGGIISYKAYDAANKKWAIRIQGNTYFSTSLLIEISNADGTNAAGLLAGLIYDIEV